MVLHMNNDIPLTMAAVPGVRADKRWLLYALVTTVTWGIWGVFAGLPVDHGFPETLNYVVWTLTMVPPAWIVLRRAGTRLQTDRRSVVLGLAAGLLGAGGQMVLFYDVRIGPTYLIFPIIALSPVLTIALSYWLLHERTGRLGVLGVVFALASLPLFDYGSGGASNYGLWFWLALGVLAAWGLQAYVIKIANATMTAESIFGWMALSAVVSIPAALMLTDFGKPIHWGWSGPGLAAVIQVLNAIGALTLVYAFRHGKAIVVSPLINAGAPLMTAVISICMSGGLPGAVKLAGVVLASIAAVLLSLPDSSES
jgi:drug/metabolite transporter (DMT)-like permease